MSWLPLALMLLLGLCCLLFARQILGFFLRGMAWQKRHIGIVVFGVGARGGTRVVYRTSRAPRGGPGVVEGRVIRDDD